MTKKEINEIGKKIKIALAEANLTQKELEKITKIKQQQISQWVGGDRTPKPDSLKKIAKATGKPLDYFFDNSIKIDNMGDKNIVGTNQTVYQSAEMDLLKKENELLKREVELYKKEIALLKKKK